MPMDAWCALYTKGYMASGSYFEHVARWHAASRAPGSPVLFLKYEALRADPRKQIRRIAAHLGLERDAAEIDRVAELIALPKPKVEKKLAQMILDKKLTGVLAQGEGRLMLHTEPNEDPTYEASLAVIKNTADVVESLFGRAEALDS